MAGQMAQMVQINCAACGKPKSVRLADYKRGWGKFCDKSCAAAYRCGQRPSDVNANHAKYSPWAKDRMEDRRAAGIEDGQHWPVCPPVKKQIGAKSVPIDNYKRPTPPNDKRLPPEDDDDFMDDMPEGWDGHKDWGGNPSGE